MSPFPPFKVYSDANVVTSKTDAKKTDKLTYAHRCWMNVPEDKHLTMGSKPFLFDCLIDGERHVWCAPATVLHAAFELFHLHRSNKEGLPYAPYLDYKRGHIYNSPYEADTKVICQLSPVVDGDVYLRLLCSL